MKNREKSTKTEGGETKKNISNLPKNLLQKTKAALYVFFNSLTNPQYYADLLKTKFDFSIKYILILALISSFITATKTTAPLTNDLTNQLNKFSTEVINTFPEELVITIKDGRLSLNTDEPFVVPISEEYQAEVITGTEDQQVSLVNVLVIDPEGTIDTMDNYKAFMMINSKNIITRQSNKLKTYPLENLPDNEINRGDIIELANRMDAVYAYLPYLILLFAFLLALIYYFGFRMIYLCVVAGILFVYSSLRGLGVRFDKLYQIGIHAMTLPLVIEVVTNVADFPINIPMWFMALNLLMGFVGLYYIDKMRDGVGK